MEMVEQETQESQKPQESSAVDMSHVASVLREMTQQIKDIRSEVAIIKGDSQMRTSRNDVSVRTKQTRVFERNEIPVGSAPINVYLRAVASAFVESKYKEVFIMGRGKYTARAIDVALITVNKNIRYAFIDSIKVESVVMDSDKTKEPVSISSILIRLKVQE